MTAMSTAPIPADDTPHAHALRLAALGLRVLPIKAGHKRPPMASWQHAATNEPAKISNWYRGLYRDAGVGLALGPQPCGRYLFALDIDTHDPAHDGWEALADLEHQHGKLPDTWRSLTGAGGAHLIYAAPSGAVVRNQQASGNRIAAGIDVRGDGGQIVVAPTIHPTTSNAYAWEHGYAPWEHDIAEAPEWLLELVREPEARAVPDQELRDKTPGQIPDARDSLFDIHRAQWNWPSELLKRGWSPIPNQPPGDDTYWVRPGKDPRAGHSAVLHGTDGPFVIFTTEIPQQWTAAGSLTRDQSGWSFSSFGFYAATEHSGDRSAAYQALAEQAGWTPDLANLIAPTEATEAGPETADDYDTDLLGMLIDWQEFAAVDHRAEEWLWEPVIPAHRAVAMWAKGGTGKSLVTLRLVLDLVTAGHRVLYLDYEMTPDDLDDRLSEMGVDDPTALSGFLHYALLPSLPAFDTPEGGKAVRRLAELVDAELVIIDTFARAVEGDENDADTVRNFYRMTGLHLKAEGRAFVRVDHAGKDGTKGQRGTSAKNDDVDLVWELRRADEGYDLIRGKCRMGWVPERVHLEVSSSPMRLNATGGDSYPAGTGALAALLDDLEVPVEAGVRKAMVVLREHGQGRQQDKVRAALKYRRNRSALSFLVDDTTTNSPVDNSGHASGHAVAKSASDTRPDTLGAKSQNPRSDQAGHASGHARTQGADATGTQRVPLKGDTRDQREPEPTDTGLFS